ncbi:MAG: helix-turn-helix domain-containing protein [Oscillospiraceae bacterium]|nr:helix-turn-helix domain-containing protein [Oscillospiraceae bacterium]
MDLGVKLRQARLEAGLSQRQLCGEEITRNMLSQIENGSARPSMDTLQYLAARLGKPVSYFLEEQSVTSPNQSVMAQARNAAGQAVLDALEKYQGPDGIFDRERWLLEALTCLELAQQALQENKKEYARALLEQAQRAGARTPYYTKELMRRRELLSFEAGLLEAVDPDQWELFLLAKSALEQNTPEKSIGLLQAIASPTEKHHFLFAQAYLQLSQYERAIEHFLQAEAYDPQTVYAGLEQCYSALEDYKQAYFYACKQRDCNEHPVRKANRIPNYDYSQNGAYFITICTEDRKQLLSQIVGDDAHIVPKPYGKILEKYIRNAPEIEKYVIMPDHIHMIIRLDDGTMCLNRSPTQEKKEHIVGADAHIRPQSRVASIVRSIKTLTAKEIGESIFQRSYYDHVIRNQQDYNEIWEYIENNPKKWMLSKKGENW